MATQTNTNTNTKTTAYVTELPLCDFCDKKAAYDARMRYRTAWAYMCVQHFQALSSDVGTGIGQFLYTNKTEQEEAETYNETNAF